MADKIQTLNTIKSKPTDQWKEALDLLAKSHPITVIETRVSVDDILKSYTLTRHVEDEIIHTSGYTTKNIKLFDANKNLLYVCENVELDNGKLFIRESFQRSNTSWYNYIFTRFARGPSINVNVRK